MSGPERTAGAPRGPAPGETRWRAGCAYAGWAFAGWQSQRGGGAVQDVLETALAGVLGRPVRIHGAGRTDAGVHARGQVFHVDAAWRHGGDKLEAALAARLPPTVVAGPVRAAPRGFHARYSAVGKRYVYVWREGRADPLRSPFVHDVGGGVRLDTAAMAVAAAALVGRHDFAALAAAGPGDGGREGTVRRVWRAEIRRAGPEVRLVVEGEGFLYKMVRSIAGVLEAVGRGRQPAGRVAELLAGGRRVPLVVTAPARGLCLEKVFYRLPPGAGRVAGP